ncbi:hypothetical protein SAMN05216289_102120 [Dokdonella immobilis]|uniref:Uncharacterized protein n=1 Tax=Dokdonella immobilis TaxID=578942 RepID=A0A1I4VIC5_9GAMM|nr:hypothetical protein SAMN05216289_102120 [Dokdonella immobilis]
MIRPSACTRIRLLHRYTRSRPVAPARSLANPDTHSGGGRVAPTCELSWPGFACRTRLGEYKLRMTRSGGANPAADGEKPGGTPRALCLPRPVPKDGPRNWPHGCWMVRTIGVGGNRSGKIEGRLSAPFKKTVAARSGRHNRRILRRTSRRGVGIAECQVIDLHRVAGRRGGCSRLFCDHVADIHRGNRIRSVVDGCELDIEVPLSRSHGGRIQ